MFKLWAHREGWSADCNEKPKAESPNNAWQGGIANKWSGNKEQWVGDQFILDISKPRVISRIKLLTEGIRHPSEYELFVRNNRDGGWEIIDKYDTLDAVLPKPRKIIGIKWVITKPSTQKWPETGLPVAWSIYDIRLTEVRLFGRWWHKVIEEK